MRLEGTSTRVPVFGFRPTRGWRWRVRKLPKPRISILSPPRRERTILSKIASTITSASFRVISTTRATSSIRSAFVIPAVLLITRSVKVSLDCTFFCNPLRVFAAPVLETHHFLDRARCHRGLTLVVLKPRPLLILRYRLQAQSDLLVRLAHLHYFEIILFSHRERRLHLPRNKARYLGIMAQSFHTLRQLDESPEAGDPRYPSPDHVADLVGGEERFPRVRLQL